MKQLLLIVVFIGAVIDAFSFPRSGQAVLRTHVNDEEEYLIELGPGDTRWIKEDEKWALRRVCIL